MENNDMPVQGFIDFELTKETLDFTTVLSHYDITATGTGDQLKIRCPFHSPDNTPSCGVNVAKKAFHCFSCHSKGNILEFVARMEALDPENMRDLKQAAELALTDIMGLDPNDFRKGAQSSKIGSGATKRPAKTTDAAKQSKQRSEPHTAPHSPSGESNSGRSNPVLEINLTLDPEHTFFEEHGISTETVEAFDLGFCNRGMMKGRIAIPIHNERGELVAYAGRWADTEIPEDTERYKLPKNFYKSLVLFNLHRAQELGGRHLVLVEGFWSAMRLHLLGIPCVASFGSSVSSDQATLIKDAGFRFVTVIFDGDAGGQAGIEQALPVLGRVVYVRAVELADGVKPDTMPESDLVTFRPSPKS